MQIGPFWAKFWDFDSQRIHKYSKIITPCKHIIPESKGTAASKKFHVGENEAVQRMAIYVDSLRLDEKKSKKLLNRVKLYGPLANGN
jgi:hypothetical protein